MPPQTKVSSERLRLFGRSPLAFLDQLTIPSCYGAVRFDSIMAPFQRERFTALAVALKAVAAGVRPPCGRYWWEATKGASKDSDLACCLLWLLTFSERPLTCQVGAADRDQADELWKAAKDVVRLNPWLPVKLDNWRLTGTRTGSVADVIAADVAGSHGARPDVLILNELSHVTKEEFAHNLMDNAEKVPHGLAVIATNAGFTGTWQAKWRTIATESDRWYAHVFAEPSPWLDPAAIAEARLRNGTARFLRLWHGVWASGAGDALDPADIEACVTSDGPMRGNEQGYVWFAGMDLGISRDHSALVVVGVNRRTKRIRLAWQRSWAPPAGGKVDLEMVRHAVIEVQQKFQPAQVNFDPFQAEHMSQVLTRHHNVRMNPVPFVGSNLNAMASTLINQIKSGNVELYRGDGKLIRDLGRLMLVEKSFGYKLESVRDADGHADLATAFVLALLGAVEANCGGGGGPPEAWRAAWENPRAAGGSATFDRSATNRSLELRERGSSDPNGPPWMVR